MKRPQTILVSGAGPGGAQAALTLARLGGKVLLIDQRADLSQAHSKQTPTDMRWNRHVLQLVRAHPMIDLRTRTKAVSYQLTADGVKATLRQQAAWVNPHECVSCEKCLQACPVGLNGSQPITIGQAPNTALIDKRRTPPCRQACPLGMHIQGYVALIAQGRFDEAYALIKKTNPLPGVLGRVCHHPCEAECRRQQIDAPVAICSLKRFASDEALASKAVAPAPPKGEGPKVAIIGAGPAGLCAAHDLIYAGLRPTIFEADKRPGGLLWQGIAPYRLPAEVVDKEIGDILALGVELRLNHPIQSPGQIEELKKQGFAAVILTIGAAQDRNLGMPGEDLEGVRGCVEFLSGLWRGRKPQGLGRVAVIGGGNAAIEAARTCLRFGAEKVTILYRRTRQEMPADPHEIEQVLEEGASLVPLASPLGFIGKNGRLCGMEFQAMQLGKKDASGRPRPVPIEGSTFKLEIDTAIVSIGQSPDQACVLSEDLPFGSKGTVDLRRDGTCLPGVYAAGDLVNGPSSVVEAMASGRRAALAVCQALGRDASSIPIPPEPEEDREDYPPLPGDIQPEERRSCPHREASLRVNDCAEVVGAYTPEEAMAEARRCLQCGVCAECYSCQNACELGAIDHLRHVQEEVWEFGRVLLSDGKPPAGLESDRIIQITRFGNKQSAAKAVLAGREAAMKAVQDLVWTGPAAPLQTGASTQARRIGVLLCSCNNTLLPGGGLEALLEPVRDWPGVAHTEVLLSACHPQAGLRIEELKAQKGLDALVLGSCACCSLDFVCESCTDQRIRLKQGLFRKSGQDQSGVALLNVRDTILLPYADAPRTAASLARAMLRGALNGLQLRRAQNFARVEPSRTALVLGAEDSGLAAAGSLAAAGREVVLLDEGKLSAADADKMIASGVTLMEACRPLELQGVCGGFSLVVNDGSGERILSGGLVILGSTGYSKLPYRSHSLVAGRPLSGGRAFASLETAVPGVYLAAWPRASSVPDSALGVAAAGQALESLLPGLYGFGRGQAWVDADLCRGCGSCMEICPQGAPRLVENPAGQMVSAIDPNLCIACGSCLAVCPTGAIAGAESDQTLYQEVLDAIL